MTKRLARPQDPETGAFIGFDENSTDSEISQDEVSGFISKIRCLNMFDHFLQIFYLDG